MGRVEAPTVKVNGPVAVKIDLADDLGDFLVRDGWICLPHHSGELLDGDVAALVCVL